MDWFESLRDYATGTPVEVYRRLWIAWGTVAGGGFTLIEGWALLDRDLGDTLTENTRPALQSNSLFVFLFSAVVLWVLYHYVWEGR